MGLLYHIGSEKTKWAHLVEASRALVYMQITGRLINMQTRISQAQMGPKFCISNTLPGDANISGCWAAQREASLQPTWATQT